MPASIPTARSTRRATRCGGAAPASRRSTTPYGEFLKVVRGFDRQHAGPAMSAFAITLDGGCGYGGKALVACLDPKGDILDLVEA